MFTGDSIVFCTSSKSQIMLRCTRQWQLWFVYGLFSLLKDLKEHPPQAALVYCDNQTTLHIATNPIFHGLTKHIEINCHLVWEKNPSKLNFHFPCKLATIDWFVYRITWISSIPCTPYPSSWGEGWSARSNAMYYIKINVQKQIRAELE